jgi:hypothetical protein
MSQIRVPKATSDAGAGVVSFAGSLSLFAPRGAEDVNGGESIRYICSRSDCKATYVVDVGTIAGMAIRAAMAGRHDLKIPISCRERAGKRAGNTVR